MANFLFRAAVFIQVCVDCVYMYIWHVAWMGGIGKGSVLLVRPLLDHLDGFLCSNGSENVSQGEGEGRLSRTWLSGLVVVKAPESSLRDEVVSGLCGSPMPLSELGHGMSGLRRLMLDIDT